MPRTIKQVTDSNQKPKTRGTASKQVASSKLGTGSPGGLRGGGVKGSSARLNR